MENGWAIAMIACNVTVARSNQVERRYMVETLGIRSAPRDRDQP